MHILDELKRADLAADHSTPPFVSLADLASARLGGRALLASDEFFAAKSNLVNPAPPVFVPGRYTSRGKWMDGWESRRRRTPGHDWCIVQLGVRGRVRGVDVDTRFFTGNYPPHCSIDAIDAAQLPLPAAGRWSPAVAEALPWTPILPRSPLSGDSHNFLPVTDDRPWTHLRLNIYPDGGVARLRVCGEAEIDWDSAGDRIIDLAAIENGGLVMLASDVHYGAKDNMLMPGRAKNMGDGWETKRRRGPGHDWAIVRLGTTGIISKIEIDTNHFKGNYPDSASIEGCLSPGATPEVLAVRRWVEVLPQTKLRAHHRHLFTRTLAHHGPVSHVRLNIFPDGGVSRFRVYGRVAR